MYVCVFGWSNKRTDGKQVEIFLKYQSIYLDRDTCHHKSDGGDESMTSEKGEQLYLNDRLSLFTQTCVNTQGRCYLET